MQISYVSGDFLCGTMNTVVHGCNAQGVMGRGAALAVKNRFPFAFAAYHEAWRRNGLRLGSVIWSIDTSHSRPMIIGNMITQEHWQAERGIDGRNVNYNAVRKCIREVNRFVKSTQDGECVIEAIGPIHHVGMPMIGAGLGGGDWKIISGIIEYESRDFCPVVYQL